MPKAGTGTCDESPKRPVVVRGGRPTGHRAAMKDEGHVKCAESTPRNNPRRLPLSVMKDWALGAPACFAYGWGEPWWTHEEAMQATPGYDANVAEPG